MKAIARSESQGMTAYLSGISNEQEMVIVSEDELTDTPSDGAGIPLASLMTQPYGDWELIEGNNANS